MSTARNAYFGTFYHMDKIRSTCCLISYKMGFPVNRAKATIGRIIDVKLINEVIELFKDYGPIHIDLFTIIFNRKYGHALDASSLGFDDGLQGFFREISDIVKIYENGYIELIVEDSITNVKNELPTEGNARKRILHQITKRKEKNLFDSSETLLWSDDYKYLLEIDLNRVQIEKSPLELNLLSQKILSREVTAIHETLVNHTEGIKLNELRHYYRFHLRSFGSISLDTLTIEYPELFYRVEPERDGDEALIYDGKTRTLDDLGGKLNSSWSISPVRICTMFVLSGLYQKTLLLIKKAGSEGLKLAVWRSTIKLNRSVFGPSPKLELETKLLDKEPIELFLALSSEGFVQIRSHKDSKNDLRIFFPSKALDLSRLFKSTRRILSFGGSESESSSQL